MTCVVISVAASLVVWSVRRPLVRIGALDVRSTQPLLRNSRKEVPGTS